METSIQRAPDIAIPSHDLVLPVWSTCWRPAEGEGTQYCGDGPPPANPPSVASPASVTFTFPRDGFEFDAEFRSVSDCRQWVKGSVKAVGPQTFVVRPAGPKGLYDVDLSAYGPEGSVIATFRWQTPHDGPGALTSNPNYAGADCE